MSNTYNIYFTSTIYISILYYDIIFYHPFNQMSPNKAVLDGCSSVSYKCMEWMGWDWISGWGEVSYDANNTSKTPTDIAL